MSEAVEVREVVVGEFPEELARLLGNEALGVTIQLSLDKMSPAARMNAIQSIAGLITSLETVQVEKAELIDLRDSPDSESRVHLLPDVSIASDEQKEAELDELVATVDEIKVDTEKSSEIDSQSTEVSCRAHRFITEIFGPTIADSFTPEDIPKVLEVLKELYYPVNNKKISRIRQVERIGLLLNGLSDKEIAALEESVTPGAIHQGRYKLMLALKEHYRQSELEAAYLGWVNTSGSGRVVSDIDATDKVKEILAEYGVEDDTEIDELDPKEQLLNLVEQAFGLDARASFDALLVQELSELTNDAQIARQTLIDLTQKYAPRYYSKLPISQDEWNALANIIGFGVKAVTVSEYHRKHLTKYNIYRTTAQGQLISATSFLLRQFDADAPVAPGAFNGANGKPAFLA